MTHSIFISLRNLFYGIEEDSAQLIAAKNRQHSTTPTRLVSSNHDTYFVRALDPFGFGAVTPTAQAKYGDAMGSQQLHHEVQKIYGHSPADDA